MHLNLNLELFPQEKRAHYTQVITVLYVLKSEKKRKEGQGKKYEKKSKLNNLG